MSFCDSDGRGGCESSRQGTSTLQSPISNRSLNSLSNSGSNRFQSDDVSSFRSPCSTGFSSTNVLKNSNKNKDKDHDESDPHDIESPGSQCAREGDMMREMISFKAEHPRSMLDTFDLRMENFNTSTKRSGEEGEEDKQPKFEQKKQTSFRSEHRSKVRLAIRTGLNAHIQHQLILFVSFDYIHLPLSPAPLQCFSVFRNSALSSLGSCRGI